MCGFSGFLGNQLELDYGALTARLVKMNDAITHRGPDSDGFWFDGESGIALGHRRLAIVDLSPAGSQPMLSVNGRYAIAFNGEIYNHLKLRQELEASNLAPGWRGHSDTETLLAGILAWGLEAALARCIGMFAIALWDRETKTLTLARDRLGEKPLYYGWQGSGENAAFLFGSELKALKEHPSFENTIDRNSLCSLLRHNYVGAPYSIYQGISKLEPGYLLTVSLNNREPEKKQYWSMAEVAISGTKDQFSGSPEQAVDVLDSLLKDAIGQQMVADVPLGAFLSGGIDSSTVVALMQAQSSKAVKTFTIGFNEEGYNEAVHAKAVATHLGTDHTELYVTAQQALDVIPRLPGLYCEPFSDSSQIPTFLVSQLARQKVTVSLSGDAGDELFCGYNRYLMADRMWSKLSHVPSGLRRAIANGITSVSPQKWNSLLNPVGRMLGSGSQARNWGDKLHKGANVLAVKSLEDLYLGLVSHWDDPASIVIGGKERASFVNGAAPDLPGLDGIQRMMALDAMTYLPDDILVKVDRASMGVSLEGRVPFLDHRIVEFAWRLPQSLKIRDGQSKWILRQVLYKYVPKSLIERPKMGFGVPIDAWLRGPLKEWAEELLDESRLRREGFFQPAPIRQKWAEHLSGKRNWQYHLWDILMFQAWLAEVNRGV